MENWAQILRRLRSALRRHGRGDGEAGDLIQDAFLRLQCYRVERPVAEPEAFLIRRGVNLAVDAHRHGWTPGEHATETLGGKMLSIDTAPGPAELLATRERIERLGEGLRMLSPRTRDIFLAHRLEAMGQAELARRQGVSLSAIEKHVAKALLFLDEWMQRD